MSRSLGCTLLTTRSPIEIVPEVMFSSPASIRSKVDLPQPEGPTSTTNAPSSIGTLTPCRTSNPPNDFRTSRICTDAIHSLPNQKLRSVRGLSPQPVFLLGGVYKVFSPLCLDQSRRLIPFEPTLRRPCRHANIIRRHEHYAQKQGVCAAGETRS